MRFVLAPVLIPLTRSLPLALMTAMLVVFVWTSPGLSQADLCEVSTIPPNDREYKFLSGQQTGRIVILATGKQCVEIEGREAEITSTDSNDHGIEVKDNDADDQDDRATVKIHVKDVTAKGDGIRVTGVRGSIDIRSDGTIAVNGQHKDMDSNGAVHVRLNRQGISSIPQSTKITVQDVDSDSSNPDGYLSAGIMVNTIGVVDILSRGTISTDEDNVAGIAVNLDEITAPNPNKVTIDVNDIRTKGENSFGIFVQTFPGFESRHTPVEVTVGGALRTEGSGAHGIAIAGKNVRADVTIETSGSIHAAMGDAIQIRENNQGDGIDDVVISNFGRLIGNVYAEACHAPDLTNSGTVSGFDRVELIQYSNQAGRDCTNPDLNLGKGQLVNRGILSPGTKGEFETSTIDADLTQDANGVLELDVGWSAEDRDQVMVTGDANLAGSLRVNRIGTLDRRDLESLLEGGEIVIVVLNASSIDRIPDLIGETAAALLSSSLLRLQENQTELALVTVIDPDIDGLNQNQTNVMAEIFNSYDFNATIETVLLELLEETELTQLKFDLDGLGNEIAGTSIQAGIRALRDHIQSESTCLDAADRGQNLSFCVEATGHAIRTERALIFEERDHRTDVSQVTTSVGWLPDTTDLGIDLSFGYARSDTRIPGLASSDQDIAMLGLGLLAAAGPVHLRLSTGASSARADITRQISFGDHSVANGKMRVNMGAINAEAAYPVSSDKWTFVPSLGWSNIHYDSKPYSETGAGDLSLQVDAIKGSTHESRIGINVAATEMKALGLMFEPHLAISKHFVSSRHIKVDSQFNGGRNSFRSTTSLLPSRWKAAIGTAFQSRSGDLNGYAGVSMTRGSDGDLEAKEATANLTFVF